MLMLLHFSWQIDTLLACGGLSKNKLYIQEHANIVGTMFIKW